MKNLFINKTPAILALEDGTILTGYSVGVKGVAVGEVVFNTAMSGYQEALTDPSYASQIILFTSPHIGNVGVNDADNESNKIWATGMVIREYSEFHSNWRANKSLSSFLREKKITAIAGVDTRYLAALIREKGALKACILAGEYNEETAINNAKAFFGLLGQDLTNKVTSASYYEQEKNIGRQATHQVIVYDYGVKKSILNRLTEKDCKVTVVPAHTSAEEVMLAKPDGIFLSNGPGDPEACYYAINNIKKLIESGIPLFGICLGHQLLALACGASTYKMKFGHHGVNHPVLDIKSGKTLITAQNHGFSVCLTTLPATLNVTHISLFDKTLQGFKHTSKPIIGFQGHPDAGPGPGDMCYLFDEFIAMMMERSANYA